MVHVRLWLTMAMLLPLSSIESSFVTFLPSAVISLSTQRTKAHHVSCLTVSLFRHPPLRRVCMGDGVRADYSVTSSSTMLTKSS